MSELVTGRKGLSRDSVRRIKEALRLPKAYARLFDLLALYGEPQLRSRQMEAHAIQQKIVNLRDDLKKLNDQTINIRNQRRVVGQPELFQTFAALGSRKIGASLIEIRQRTGIDEATIRTCLSILENEGIIEKLSERYHVIVSQVDLFGLNGSDGLDGLIFRTCGDIQDRRKEILADKHNLVFYSCFSVKQSQLDVIRERIRDAIFNVLDDVQDDDGDHVMQFFFAGYGAERTKTPTSD